jgi:hypothetical protein
MKRKMPYGLFAVVVIILSGICCTAADASKVFEVDHEFYPYYPSLIKLNKSSAGFTDPAVCAGCHADKFKEWMGSVHALAFKDPIYQGELNKGFKAVGHNVTRQCEGCHSPRVRNETTMKEPRRVVM